MSAAARAKTVSQVFTEEIVDSGVKAMWDALDAELDEIDASEDYARLEQEMGGAA